MEKQTGRPVSLRSQVGMALLLPFTFVLGGLLASSSDSDVRALRVEQRLTQATDELSAREGELELARLELSRLNHILQYSALHHVPADLAASIYDIALQEGIDPAVGFGLVSVESEFTRRAISSKGAVGLTQLLPSTAFWLQPGVAYGELFQPDVNLRLGFRYLRQLLAQYDGDLRLALLAYNRGPGSLDELLRVGDRVSDGYARAVKARASRTN